MGHPLEKQFFLAFLCLSMAVTISATRKEELERAAELAVERAAERAAERAVEKALEAGNTTSTTITVKESYSNARKTAEEQAAPGSESTRNNNKETSIFETKDTDDPFDYEPSSHETDYNDNNESRDYSNEDSSEYGNYNDSRGYSDYNDSRGYSDYNDSRGYSDYNDSRGYSDYKDFKDFSELKDSKSLGDYNDSRVFGDFNESKKFKAYNEPRGFGNYNSGSRDFNDSENFRDPRGYNQSKSYNDFGDKNYTGSKDYRGSNNNSQGNKDFRSLKDYGNSKGYEVEEDYSSSLNQTDYQKLNSSKPLRNPEIKFLIRDFDLSSTDSNLPHGFGTKLLGFGTKLTTSALSEDVSFYSAETDFSKKRNSKKEDGEVDDANKDDSWKSYSDWKKDFKSHNDETFSKDDEPFLKGYDEPFTKDFWNGDDVDSPHKSSRPFWADGDYTLSSKTKKEDKTEYGSKTNPQGKGRTLSSTHKYSKQPLSKDYDFSTFTRSWQPDNKNSRPTYKSYIKRSSGNENYAGVIIPPYHKRLSRDNDQKKTSNGRYTNRSEEEYKEGPYEKFKDKSNEQSKEQFRDESNEDYKEKSYERSTEETTKRLVEEFRKKFSYESIEETKKKSYETPKEEELKNRPTGKSKEQITDKSSEEYEDRSDERFKERSNVKFIERLPEESREEYKKKSSNKSEKSFADEAKEEYEDRSSERSTAQSKERSPDESEEKYKKKFYEQYNVRPNERRIEGITDLRNIGYASTEKDKNVSEDVKTISFNLEAPPLNVYRQAPIDVKGSRQPYTTYKVPKNIPIPVPVTLPLPVNLPTPVQHEEISQETEENRKFLQNLYDSLNIPIMYPFISQTKLKVAKPIFKEVVDANEVPKLHSGQKRLPIQKQHQQVLVDDRLPMLIKMGIPGPFPIENDNLQLEKPHSVPVKVYVENPYTIHLDKSIPLALKERVPFIIHVPLKSKENDGWSEARHSKKYENVPAESQTLIKRVSWV